MTCAACAVSVETILQSQKGVSVAKVNFASNSAIIEYDPETISEELLRSTLQEVGYDIVPEIKVNSAEETLLREKDLFSLKHKTLLSGVFAFPTFLIGMFFMDMPFANYIMWALSTPVLAIWGRSFFINAVKQLKHRTANMDTLVALSTGIAYLFSVFNTLDPQFWHQKGLHPHVYFEASVVIIFFILLGKLLEERAKKGTSEAIKKLMGLQPKFAHLINIDQTETEIPINVVKSGDLLAIKPGEKIPVDGVVISGESFVDESSINGESIPDLKITDSKVFAGTINQKGHLKVKATHVGELTVLSQIVKMVQAAQGSKAPIQKLTDKIAGIFVPVVIVVSVITFMSWMLFGNDNKLTMAFLSSITVLVIACPCALGLATPTALMVGIGKAALHGILIKDADALEMSRKITDIVLDKTGTITQGKPTVDELIWDNSIASEHHLSSVLVSIESKSEHPLASAVCEHLKNSGISDVTSFESVSGKGLKGIVNGAIYYAGSLNYINELGIAFSDQLKNELNRLNAKADSIIVFSDSKNALAIVGIKDQIKDGSIIAIQELKQANIKVHMLTGDHESVAKNIASIAGIQNFKASVLPADKAQYIQGLQTNGSIVAMVGDGINDSHALAQADVSFAMGKGTDIAMDVAGVTIMSSDLRQLSKAIKLSKQTVAKIRQNLFWAFIYNVIGIPLAAGVLYPLYGIMIDPMIAGAAMALSSVSVVSNSLLLKFKRL